MSKIKKFKKVFAKLVTAYDEGEDDEKESLTKQIKDSGKTLRVKVKETLQWEESQVEGYKECPLVIQTFKIFLDEEEVYEGECWYGSEMVDPTHTGHGERWESIRVDEGGEDGVIELLEDFGLSIESPDVPEWR